MIPEQLNTIKARHQNATDAEFIGYARQDVGMLLEHIEQLESVLESERRKYQDELANEWKLKLMDCALKLETEKQRAESAEKAEIERVVDGL